MAQDSDLERTEPATAKRLRTAREEGNVPRSRELSTFAITMAGVGLLIALGGELVGFLSSLMRRIFTFDYSVVRSTEPVLIRFREAIFEVLWQLAPFFGVLALVALSVPLLIGGWNLTFKAFQPKWSKLNVISGIRRLFSLQSATEGAKAILKSLLIGGVATGYIWYQRGDIIGLGSLPLEVGMTRMTELVLQTFLVVASAMIVLVAIDVPYQLWNYHKKLRMTKEEVRQEYKESEGSPEVKGRIRQMQKEAARKRMMQEVPTANVIVTNPTHYAVALKYQDGMVAPQVVAKGTLRLAEKIIALGQSHQVAIMRAPRFARALYFHAELGQNIPSELYSAAAQVLAYVFQLHHYQQQGGVAPVFPHELEVPDKFDTPQRRAKNNAI